MTLQLIDVLHTAGAFRLEVSAEFRGPVTGLYGVSGSGKSTLLELVAGLRPAERGRILLDGEVMSDAASGFHLPPERRGIGFVPQDGALFPHLTVGGNLTFAEKRAANRKPRLERQQVCTLLGIEALLDRTIDTLSGGERQRVAIARALLAAPRLLLLDEPLASLDAGRKAVVLPYLQRVRDELRVPMLYVSHVPQEVIALCDEMAVLSEGRLLQTGAVQEVFRRPANPAVARIVGVETVVPGRVLGGDGALTRVAVDGTAILGVAEDLPAATENVFVSIRAEDVTLIAPGANAATSARNRLLGRVVALAAEGATVRVEIDCGFTLTALLTRQAIDELQLAPGAPITALIKAPNVHLIPRT